MPEFDGGCEANEIKAVFLWKKEKKKKYIYIYRKRASEGYTIFFSFFSFWAT